MPIYTANMLIDFRSQQVYNIDNFTIFQLENWLIIAYILFFVKSKKGTKIMDEDDLEGLRQAVKEAAQECTDTSMLDLVLKLLLME